MQKREQRASQEHIQPTKYDGSTETKTVQILGPLLLIQIKTRVSRLISSNNMRPGP